jgi:hypothetical protein
MGFDDTLFQESSFLYDFLDQPVPRSKTSMTATVPKNICCNKRTEEGLTLLTRALSSLLSTKYKLYEPVTTTTEDYRSAYPGLRQLSCYGGHDA